MNVADILSELDDNGFEDTDESRKVAYINDVIQDVCSRDPWPFLEKQATVTLNSQQVALPADFRAALSLVIPGQGVLTPERTDTVTKNYLSNANAPTGVPGLYYFVGSTMYLYPTPNTSYSAILYYLCLQSDVTAASVSADILIPSRHHRVITLGTLAKLNAQEDDPELYALFNQQYEERLIRMESDVWKRQYDRPDRIVDLWNDNDYYC